MRVLSLTCECGHQIQAGLYDERRCVGSHALEVFASTVGLLLDAGALPPACVCGSACFHFEDRATPLPSVDAALAGPQPRVLLLASAASGGTL